MKRIAESSPQQGTRVYGPRSRIAEESIRWKRDACTAKSNNRWEGHKRQAQVRVVYFRIQIMAKDKQYRHLLSMRSEHRKTASSLYWILSREMASMILMPFKSQRIVKRSKNTTMQWFEWSHFLHHRSQFRMLMSCS